MLAFRELVKLLNQLGGAIKFVTNKLSEELDTMDYHLAGKQRKHYEQLETMAVFEIKHKIIRKKVRHD